MKLKQLLPLALTLLLPLVLVSCGTTSGSSRLDKTGNDLAAMNGDVDPSEEPEKAIFYIQALRGGLMSRMAGVNFSKSERVRGLETEYKTLETAPSGQKLAWESGNVRGEVTAAVPYQVGSQNCRQYTHSIVVSGSQPVIARGAACRNANGTWTPLV